MIAGKDSSFDRPNAATLAQAYAAGVRVWGGYIGLRPLAELGLATVWGQADFDVILNAGMTAIGFCSGWDDPVAIRDRASAWGVLPCVDVETGIRTDGLWLDDWLPAAGAGLYGLASLHYETGRPDGRGAVFNIVADYLAAGCTGETWPSWLPRPAAPCGWQCQGGHPEFGIDVDSMSLDDWFGGDMTPEEHQMLQRVHDTTEEAWTELIKYVNENGGYPVGKLLLDTLAAAKTPAPVDVNALAAALTPHLPPATDPAVVARAVADELEARLKN